MPRKQIVILAGSALIAAAGVGTGAAIAAGGSPGSSYGWMMSQAGYQWMTGGTSSPGVSATPGLMPTAYRLVAGGSGTGKSLGPASGDVGEPVAGPIRPAWGHYLRTSAASSCARNRR